MYEAIKKRIDSRNWKEERRKLFEELDQLEGATKVSSLALKGNYVLESVRGEIDEGKFGPIKADPTNVHMTLLNDYLNSYTEKLARATLDHPSAIKIDKQDFNQIVKAVLADAYNPYTHDIEM